MSLPTYPKYIAYMALAFSLSACLAIQNTPVVGYALAEKGDTRPFEVPLPVNTKPKRLALSHSFAIGVKEDGTVWSWGRGGSGVLGTGYINRDTPQAIPNMTDFVEVAVGSEHVLALRKDGSVWSWGDNKKGQLGYKEDGVPYGEPSKILYDPQQLTPKQIPDLKDIVSIAAGGNFSVALDKEGRVWGWGGDLEMPNSKTIAPKMILQNIDAAKVIGNVLSVAFGILTKTGKVKLWQYGKITEPMFNGPVVDVAVGPATLNTYFLLDTGKVYSVGINFSGELGCCVFKNKVTEPVLILSIGHIVKIDSYSALDDKGRVWQWGREAGIAKDYIFFSTSNIYAQPYPRVMLRSKNIVDIYCCSFALAKDGTVWAWGSNQSGRRGDNNERKANNSHRYWTTPVRSLWTWK